MNRTDRLYRKISHFVNSKQFSWFIQKSFHEKDFSLPCFLSLKAIKKKYEYIFHVNFPPKQKGKAKSLLRKEILKQWQWNCNQKTKGVEFMRKKVIIKYLGTIKKYLILMRA